MKNIKSLADELRGNIGAENIETIDDNLLKGLDSKALKKFHALKDFKISGEKKVMVRLDPDSLRLLRHFKMTGGVEMSKVILFALREFIIANAWIREYIKEQIK